MPSRQRSTELDLDPVVLKSEERRPLYIWPHGSVHMWHRASMWVLTKSWYETPM